MGSHFQPAKEVIAQHEWMRKECDVTILLSHLGYEDDRAMADAFPWLDLIIGGHTHTQLKGNEMQNGVLITQNKNKLPFVTHITLTVDSGRVVDKHSEYIDVNAFTKTNKVVEVMVRCFLNNPVFQRVLAKAGAPFEAHEELGCMVCDAFIDGCDAEIAVENQGGVRVERLPMGDITVRDVLEIDPFDNYVVVMQLTGDEIVRMMLSYCQNRLWSFPFVGGIRCQLTPDKKNPRLVKSVKLLTLDGKKLDMKRRYRVVTNSYVSATSDIPEGSVQSLNIMTTNLIMRYIEKKGTLDYQGVRRLEVMP